VSVLRGERSRHELWTGAVIDVDVNVVPKLTSLYPYLDGAWIQYAEERGWAGPSPSLIYPRGLDATAGPQWRSEDGAPPDSTLPVLQGHILDPWEVDHAILNCTWPIDTGLVDLSVALARAANDWLIAEWLDPDPRVRASIVVPTHSDPAAMAAEIDRVGDHPGFVQVLLPARSGIPYGRRSYWPVFDAISRHDLVAGIHFGGVNDGQPSSPLGWASWYAEEYAAEVQVFEAQLGNLVAEGTFQRYPELRVAMLECGFAWVPMWMWDQDRNWKALHREIPWVRERPFELVRRHVRFSTSPLEVPSADALAPVVGWLGSDELLMFATDYPHWHGDDLAVLLGALPEALQPKVMSENARQWYRLAA
jgi:predicted TIM-barrel fold metal-dependent hydrolase